MDQAFQHWLHPQARIIDGCCPSTRLHQGYEQLIGYALLDPLLRLRLLHDPRGTAERAGISSADLSLIVDIVTDDFAHFCRVLNGRLYRKESASVPLVHAAAG
jgi:hypothetical protein